MIISLKIACSLYSAMAYIWKNTVFCGVCNWWCTDLIALGIEENAGDFGEGSSLSRHCDTLVVAPFPQSDTAISGPRQV